MDVYVGAQSPAVALVDTLIIKALQVNASDIHLEPTGTHLRVRLRIDGLLHDNESIKLEHALQVLSRIKVLSHMDIAERRIPQDGKFTFIWQSASIDIRVATFPSIYGEKVVIRILNGAATALSLEYLGFESSLLTLLEKVGQKAAGFFLVTGPTGSGKTTTLHAMLAHVRSSTKNSVTLEDPVEYTVEGITQAQIYPAIGFTFERGIRALLRQDPDIIMVGEIRDPETARVALQAAITGHFVMSTVHTNDAPSTLLRLLDMGIEPFLLNAAITGILSQRLVRKLCVQCRYQALISNEEEITIKELKLPITLLYKSAGCTACKGMGYKGRIGIFELMLISHELRALVAKQPHFDSLYNQACRDGMKPLLIDAAQKVNAGIIDLQEVIRVLT